MSHWQGTIHNHFHVLPFSSGPKGFPTQWYLEKTGQFGIPIGDMLVVVDNGVDDIAKGKQPPIDVDALL